MPRFRRRSVAGSAISNHVDDAVAVLSRGRIHRSRTVDPRLVGEAIGAGRIAIGAVFFAAPVTALRIVGADSATAQRVSWLSRMTAARDTVLGVGTLQSVHAGRGSGWLLAGAVADAVDAAAVASAVRDRRAGGIGAFGMIGGAAAASAIGVWAALAARRR